MVDKFIQLEPGKHKDIIHVFLTSLGLSSHEAKVYQILIQNGVLTTLEVSRRVGLPRTSVYRMLESLKVQGLVEEVVEQYKTKVQAVAPDQLELLVKRKEEEAAELRTQLPTTTDLIYGSQTLKQPGTRVLFYRGIEGIRQMIWHVLKTEKLYRGFTFQNWQDLVGEKFVEEWSIEFDRKHIPAHDLCSDEYLENRKKTRHVGVWRNWERRYVPSSVVTIDHQIDIYNDTVAFYHWEEGEIFGVEINNERVARLQKQVFDVLWKLGKPMSETTTEKLGMPQRSR